MRSRPWIRPAARVLAAGAGVAVGAYSAYVATSWYRYGRVPEADEGERDEWLDQFMPAFEIVERHQICVDAPAAVTLATACEQDLFNLPLVRTIFRMREIIFGATPDARLRPRGLLAAMQQLGWGVLAHVPGLEIVVGAVTKPWEPDVVFRGLPPNDYASFSEPGFVKIIWTLRADPLEDERSIFRTETRAIATDATARARFRRYWAFVSPGIALIRRLSLRPLKRDAERRARAAAST